MLFNFYITCFHLFQAFKFLQTSLAIVALGTVSFISRGITGSQDVGRSLTGGPFLEPARRNVAEFDLCSGGGGA